MAGGSAPGRPPGPGGGAAWPGGTRAAAGWRGEFVQLLRMWAAVKATGQSRSGWETLTEAAKGAWSPPGWLLDEADQVFPPSSGGVNHRRAKLLELALGTGARQGPVTKGGALTNNWVIKVPALQPQSRSKARRQTLKRSKSARVDKLAEDALEKIKHMQAMNPAKGGIVETQRAPWSGVLKLEHRAAPLLTWEGSSQPWGFPPLKKSPPSPIWIPEPQAICEEGCFMDEQCPLARTRSLPSHAPTIEEEYSFDYGNVPHTVGSWAGGVSEGLGILRQPDFVCPPATCGSSGFGPEYSSHSGYSPRSADSSVDLPHSPQMCGPAVSFPRGLDALDISDNNFLDESVAQLLSRCP